MFHEMIRFRSRTILPIASLLVCLLATNSRAQETATETQPANQNDADESEAPVTLETDGYEATCDVKVAQKGTVIEVQWPLESGRRGRVTFDLNPSHALMESIAAAPANTAEFRVIAQHLDPTLQIRVGNRDLEKRDGWTVFFDRMQRKPNEVHVASIQPKRAVVTGKHSRATLTIGNVKAGSFEGSLRWTFFAGSSFLLQEAVLKTQRPRTAFLYDSGLVCRTQLPSQMKWFDSNGVFQSQDAQRMNEPIALAVRGRSVAAQFAGGSIGIFPPPHRYFYPLDFSNNFKNIWAGPNYGGQTSEFGFGIRHAPDGDNRYVPGFNAPPGSVQHMGMFFMISDASADETLAKIGRLTRRDRFAKLPGHRVFTSHFHVEHTLDFLNRKKSKTFREVVPSSRETAQVWKFTTAKPSDDWKAIAFDDSTWKQGPGGFGRKGTRGLKFGTTWTSSDIWLRRKFELSETPRDDLRIILQHDEDTEIYLNGVPAAEVDGFSPEYRDLRIRPEAMRAIRKGTNVMSVHCWNDGGGQAIDVGLGFVDQSTSEIPKDLQTPGFVKVFKRMGVDVVHLAEFHNGRTPKLKTWDRLNQLRTLHRECKRLSDGKLLLLPGEEPNVHLGGHWISFFPKPVYWVLNRPEGTPFVSRDEKLGRVYHVGSEADVHRLLREENGLAWTAHPRIKSSAGFPDRYRDRLFYQSPQFLGGAWKAMPADLSQPKLGSRVLNLLDDMSNWGPPKVALGEVDVFKIDPDHELYGHMNVNYLRLEKLPSFEDGWQPILDVLRDGKFFVTTGEVLIPNFTVGGQQSGEAVSIGKAQSAKVHLDLKWTFPLAFAEVITGDGRGVTRTKIDLSHTQAFGELALDLDINVAGKRWLRVEVWDVATNGAFTQPVWLQSQ